MVQGLGFKVLGSVLGSEVLGSRNAVSVLGSGFREYVGFWVLGSPF